MIFFSFTFSAREHLALSNFHSKLGWEEFFKLFAELENRFTQLNSISLRIKENCMIFPVRGECNRGKPKYLICDIRGSDLQGLAVGIWLLKLTTGSSQLLVTH